MAATQLKAVFPASPAVNDKVLAARNAVHQYGQTLGFKRVSFPAACFLDHRDVAKEMHGRWATARADFEKKKLSEDASINCALDYTEKGLAYEFSATMGKNEAKPAQVAPGQPVAVERTMRTLDIRLAVPVGLTASEHAVAARQQIIQAAGEFGVGGFTFPIRDHETQACIVEDRAWADMHAQNVYYDLGFVRAPRVPGLFLRDGRFVWEYLGHVEVENGQTHKAEAERPFLGLTVTER